MLPAPPRAGPTLPLRGGAVLVVLHEPCHAMPQGSAPHPAHASALPPSPRRGLRAVRQGRVALVDGNQHFNRPGPRLVDALEWLVGWVGAGGRREHVAASYPQPEGFPWEQLAPLEQEEQQAGAGPQAGEAEAHGVQGAAM